MFCPSSDNDYANSLVKIKRQKRKSNERSVITDYAAGKVCIRTYAHLSVCLTAKVSS